jgi:hypothetical protein
MVGKSGLPFEPQCFKHTEVHRHTSVLNPCSSKLYSKPTQLIPVPVFKIAGQGLEIFRFLLSHIQYATPRFEVQKVRRGRSWILPILPISNQLQVLREEHAQNFVNIHCSVVPTADCSKTSIAWCYYVLRRLHSLISDPITEHDVVTSQDFPLEGSKCENSQLSRLHLEAQGTRASMQADVFEDAVKF